MSNHSNLTDAELFDHVASSRPEPDFWRRCTSEDMHRLQGVIARKQHRFQELLVACVSLFAVAALWLIWRPAPPMDAASAVFWSALILLVAGVIVVPLLIALIREITEAPLLLRLRDIPDGCGAALSCLDSDAARAYRDAVLALPRELSKVDLLCMRQLAESDEAQRKAGAEADACKRLHSISAGAQ
jgi:hypothetical protein